MSKFTDMSFYLGEPHCKTVEYKHCIYITSINLIKVLVIPDKAVHFTVFYFTYFSGSF